MCAEVLHDYARDTDRPINGVNVFMQDNRPSAKEKKMIKLQKAGNGRVEWKKMHVFYALLTVLRL